MQMSELFANQDRITFISIFLAAQASNFYHGPWVLQCFGHIQSKHEDAKSEVVSFKNQRKVQPIQIMPGGCYYVKRLNEQLGSIYSRSQKNSGFLIVVHLNNALSIVILSHFSALDTNVRSTIVPFQRSLCISFNSA